MIRNNLSREQIAEIKNNMAVTGSGTIEELVRHITNAHSEFSLSVTPKG